MILLTGATGFIGSHALPKLYQRDYKIRVLMPPSEENYIALKNIPVELAICGINDVHNLGAALKSVETIIHLATDENHGQHADLETVDIQGTRSLLEACKESSVKRIIYVSYIGAEPASAYPLLKTKGIVEQMIVNSGINYTILKTGPIFGTEDHFLSKLAAYFKTLPFIYFLPDKGKAILHPLWVEDLVSSVIGSLENSLTINQTISIGGPEYYSIGELSKIVQQSTQLKQLSFSFPSSSLRLMLLFWQILTKGMPVSSYDLDMLSVDRTAPIDNITKFFGILPYSLREYLLNQRN